MHTLSRLLVLLAHLLAACGANAEGSLFKVPTRDGVVTTLFWETAPNAQATVLLFPGGDGGFGKLENGKATSSNFLVRSTPLFLVNGFNVAIFGRPTDTTALGWADRTEANHMTDIAKVLAFVKQKSSLPVWIVGTSRGTVSATAMAIKVRDPAIAGLVLTSSVVRMATPGAVPSQDLKAIQIPVLVYHHAQDACTHCKPSDTPLIIAKLTNAPIKKLMLVDGGSRPSGDACGSQHWHGFVGMEPQAIHQIANWIKNPIH
ncbi:hypothetical protein AZ34_05040 [Hylemonella gracilis str. Niagara R]|uniref:Alpha/beta hydrolase n=1 Tax=Hylemonella gracilis str. Niagara R TaxID=1458275 RepID=A0A016XEH7_9BURK|nr:alpha/beta hydrolase [Hylemonella gracilis]EYC50489.1 hypothetical protein AZ34_05040 [Hylemonella gracilis str. Niagara R]